MSNLAEMFLKTEYAQYGGQLVTVGDFQGVEFWDVENECQRLALAVDKSEDVFRAVVALLTHINYQLYVYRYQEAPEPTEYEVQETAKYNAELAAAGKKPYNRYEHCFMRKGKYYEDHYSHGFNGGLIVDEHTVVPDFGDDEPLEIYRFVKTAKQKLLEELRYIRASQDSA